MKKLPPRLSFDLIMTVTVMHPAHRHQPVPVSPGNECDTDLSQLALEVVVTLTCLVAVEVGVTGTCRMTREGFCLDLDFLKQKCG